MPNLQNLVLGPARGVIQYIKENPAALIANTFTTVAYTASAGFLANGVYRNVTEPEIGISVLASYLLVPTFIYVGATIERLRETRNPRTLENII